MSTASLDEPRWGLPSAPASASEELTVGKWATERESAAAFDACVEETGLFHVVKEVPGYFDQRRLGQAEVAPRLDRVLRPGLCLLELGWPHGSIGIEIKRSQEKIGQPIAQMGDYSRSLFRMEDGDWLRLSWIFLWPCRKQHGPLASHLAQNRLGTAFADSWNSLVLHSGEVSILRVSRTGDVLIGSAVNGLRSGSR